jgi:hypothetical protein
MGLERFPISNKAIFYILLNSFIYLTLISSCKKKSESEPICIGGQEGNLSFKIIPYLNGSPYPIPNASTYAMLCFIKYNTLNRPPCSPRYYDPCADKEFELYLPSSNIIYDLSCGDYYISINISDTSNPPKTYFGEIPFSTTATSGQLEIHIPIQHNCDSIPLFSWIGDLRIYLQHQGMAIPNLPNYPDSVFVKYNTDVFPGSDPSLYNVYFTGISGEPFVNCTFFYHPIPLCENEFSLYIFATGKDASNNQRVTGGIPITINVEDTTTVHYITVPVNP